MITDLLDYYTKTWFHLGDEEEESRILARFRQLLGCGQAMFQRNFYLDGHITASSLIVSPNLDRVLLTLHGKLKRWLQLGGHTDGETDVHLAALREACEESGLKSLTFLSYESALSPTRPLQLAGIPIPFDLDVHTIPAWKSEPAHCHYDVRYAMVADPREPLLITNESDDLRWFSIAEARAVTNERSILRQFDKLACLHEMMARRID